MQRLDVYTRWTTVPTDFNAHCVTLKMKTTCFYPWTCLVGYNEWLLVACVCKYRSTFHWCSALQLLPGTALKTASRNLTQPELLSHTSSNRHFPIAPLLYALRNLLATAFKSGTSIVFVPVPVKIRWRQYLLVSFAIKVSTVLPSSMGPGRLKCVTYLQQKHWSQQKKGIIIQTKHFGESAFTKLVYDGQTFATYLNSFFRFRRNSR